MRVASKLMPLTSYFMKICPVVLKLFDAYRLTEGTQEALFKVLNAPEKKHSSRENKNHGVLYIPDYL
jgi:hypothetical protein